MTVGHRIAIVLAAALAAFALLGAGSGTKRTSVPWMLGLSEARAEKRLEDRALHAEVLERSADARKLPRRYRQEGHIVFQEYRGGIVLPTGSTVRVMVYKPGRGER